MTKPTPEPPKIEMRLEGPAVPGRISVDTLAAVAKELQTSLRRMLASPRRGGGRFPTGIEQTCALDLTAFAKGSAVLTFEYAGQRDRDTLYGDPGVRVAEEMLDAMQQTEAGKPAWEQGLPQGVIDGWDTLSKELGNGIESIGIALVYDGHRREVTLTPAFRKQLRASVVRETPAVEESVEGVLGECDWKRHLALLDEVDGNRVVLELSDELEERVTNLRRRRVRVRGTVERRQGRTIRIAVTDVTLADDSSTVDPRFGGFWENLSADELARRQGVGPVEDVSKLAGDWPPEDSIDDFFVFVREVRGG